MISLLHVATGAALGTVVRSRPLVSVLGVALHLAEDGVPHRDTDERFELVSGLLGLALVARRRGPLDSATIGALACGAPDVEHVVPLSRGGGKLFHEGRGWHRSGNLSVRTQLLLAGLVLACVPARRRDGRARTS